MELKHTRKERISYKNRKSPGLVDIIYFFLGASSLPDIVYTYV